VNTKSSRRLAAVEKYGYKAGHLWKFISSIGETANSNDQGNMPAMMNMTFQVAVTLMMMMMAITTTIINYCKVSVVQVSVNKYTRLKLKPSDNMEQWLS
jgi:hypothetical protein